MPQTVDSLLSALRSHHPAASTPELARSLGTSVPTVQRLLRRAGDGVVTRGQARRTRHAARRALRGSMAPLPVHRINAQGMAEPFGTLALIAPEGTAMALTGSGWPVPDDSRDGWWGGLPYPLQDMRPQGYLGRQFAHALADVLQLSADPRAWSDDDTLVALSFAGTDNVGDLVVGAPALRRWQAARLQEPVPTERSRRSAEYAECADRALAGEPTGSSAAGECPKFTALRALPGDMAHGRANPARTPHVLVKFSGPEDTVAGRRWADLLIAEDAALRCLAEGGVAAARSDIVQAAGRTFLETERFDRHGLFGRSPVVALEAVNAAFLGAPARPWPELAARLAALGVLAEDTLSHIARLTWFGRLIANTDMHLGNLSLRPAGAVFTVAPAYDMLPMRYAPQASGDVPDLDSPIAPALPLPAERTEWRAAAHMARATWARVAADSRVSPPFRDLATRQDAVLAHAAERV